MRLITSQNYPYWAFAALAIGLFISVADLGSSMVALPTISVYFDSDLPTAQWVIIGYQLTISALLLPMGRLADIIGRKRVYVTGVLIVVVAGVAAGLSQSVGFLIFAKAAQGVGSAMTQGTSMAMLVAAFPQEERGKALGLQMSVVGFGGIAGPAFGGLIVGQLGWQWVFFAGSIGAAVAAIAAVLVIDSARAGRSAAPGVKFDWLGAGLSSAALVAFLQGMTWAPRIGYGSPIIALAFAGFIALLAAFVYRELRFPFPMMDVRLFARRLFSMGVLASYLNFLGMSSVRFLMPFYLQAVLGLTATQVGLAIIPGAVCMTIFGPLSGRLSDRFGWRWFTMGGLLTSMSGLLILSTLSPSSPLPLAMAGMILQSMGIGIFNAPNNSSILSAVEQSKYGVITGFLNLVRNAGNLCSVAIGTAIVTGAMAALGYPPSLSAVSADGGDAGVLSAFTIGLRYTYAAMAGVVLIGVIASAFKGKTIVIAEAPEPAGSRG